MAAKPIKSLKWHYTMIQFLITTIIIQHIVTLPKYGHGALIIHRPWSTDILRYSLRNFVCQGEKYGKMKA